MKCEICDIEYPKEYDHCLICKTNILLSKEVIAKNKKGYSTSSFGLALSPYIAFVLTWFLCAGEGVDLCVLWWFAGLFIVSTPIIMTTSLILGIIGWKSEKKVLSYIGVTIALTSLIIYGVIFLLPELLL